jgi:MFS family permease
VTYPHFLIALILLGIGWNFLFLGGTTLLTEAYSPAEKAKTQGINDFIVSTTVACTALSSGYLNFTYGWETLNELAIPAVLVALLATIWLMVKRRTAQVETAA